MAQNMSQYKGYVYGPAHLAGNPSCHSPVSMVTKQWSSKARPSMSIVTLGTGHMLGLSVIRASFTACVYSPDPNQSVKRMHGFHSPWQFIVVTVIGGRFRHASTGSGARMVRAGRSEVNVGCWRDPGTDRCRRHAHQGLTLNYRMLPKQEHIPRCKLICTTPFSVNIPICSQNKASLKHSGMKKTSNNIVFPLLYILHVAYICNDTFLTSCPTRVSTMLSHSCVTYRDLSHLILFFPYTNRNSIQDIDTEKTTPH